jgi:AraC-like DNA-binding protein
MGWHKHQGWELSIVLQGQGQFIVEDQSYLLEAGHVILIPSNLPHNYKSITDIRFAVIEAVHLDDSLLALFMKLVPGNQPNVLFLSYLDLIQYEVLFKQFLKITSQVLREQAMFLGTWITLFILFVNHHAHFNLKMISIQEAATHLRTYLNENVQVKDLARMAGLSTTGFRKAFITEFGITPKQYQQKFRLTETKWLLRSSETPIQDIAIRVGFSGIYPFSAWFQKMNKISPTEWRKRQKLDFND